MSPLWMRNGFCLLALLGTASAAEIMPLPEKVPCAVPDKQDFQIPDRVQLTGWLGTRITANEANRLVKMDTDRLLEGYRKRPGRQSWDGEHIGKWLHAATLAWVNTGDPALRAKLDATAAELCKCQLPDGYLGTYLDKDRWTEWDVWAHKYNLIGLITYIRYTGNTAPLATCTRMADLLCKTFGDGPGQRDIITAGHHAGMAPTSVLEPMVLLYRFTGEKRYLDFCNYILRAWEQPNGPHIVSRLLELKRVDKVGNAKAYEMLSCLNGALELYRTTGDKKLLEACENAWQDIVKNRLYITGAASYREHFHDDFDLPNVNNVGETCVTVTWLQFNAQLLRLTGEAKFAEQLERVVYNQLLGAQKPDGSAWGYYVQMEGKKPYSSTLDGHCCLSSGPRGIALLPTFAITTDADGIVINLYDAGTNHLKLRDGTPVMVKIETQYPSESLVRIAIETPISKPFAVKLRIPTSASEPKIFTSLPLEIPGKIFDKPEAIETKAYRLLVHQEAGTATSILLKKVDRETASDSIIGRDGYIALRGSWKRGDTIEADWELAARVVIGDHLNQGKMAICYGPLVLTADEALLAEGNHRLNNVFLRTNTIPLDRLEPAPSAFKTWDGAKVFRILAAGQREKPAAATPKSLPIKSPSSRDYFPISIRLIPFADAGMTGARYKVWLPLAGAPSANVLLDGTESRSRQGNQNGSINDDDPGNCAVTFDGKPAKEDWFAVTLDAPATIRRIVFAHGKNFHDGGWFVGKPMVQIQREKNGAWETVGTFSDYPATTTTDGKKLKSGQSFTLKLAAPVNAIALRVIGTSASGDNPGQAFSSCAELQAFSE